MIYQYLCYIFFLLCNRTHIFLITNNAEKLRIRLEELFNANTVYIQRIKDRPLEARKDVDERDLEKLINVLFYLVM